MSSFRRCGIMIFFHFGINIGTTNIANPRRKVTSQEDYRQFVLVGTIVKSKIR